MTDTLNLNNIEHYLNMLVEITHIDHPLIDKPKLNQLVEWLNDVVVEATVDYNKTADELVDQLLERSGFDLPALTELQRTNVVCQCDELEEMSTITQEFIKRHEFYHAMTRKTPHKNLWDDAAFCERVKELARQQHITIKDVVTKAGLSLDYFKTSVNRRGRQTNIIMLLAEVLNVTPAYLCGWGE